MSAAAEVFATPSILLMILERLPTSTNLVMLDRTSKVFRLVLRHQVFDKRMGRSLRIKPLPPPSLRSTLWKPPPGSSKAQVEPRKAERASADADKAKTEKAVREEKSREDKAKAYRGKADKAKEKQVKEKQAKEARARPEKDASEPKEKKRKTGTSRMAGQSAGRKDKFQHYRRVSGNSSM
jgi:type IV secretory pathway VirB10-like protein